MQRLRVRRATPRPPPPLSLRPSRPLSVAHSTTVVDLASHVAHEIALAEGAAAMRNAGTRRHRCPKGAELSIAAVFALALWLDATAVVVPGFGSGAKPHGAAGPWLGAAGGGATVPGPPVPL